MDARSIRSLRDQRDSVISINPFRMRSTDANRASSVGGGSHTCALFAGGKAAG